ncbi:efflux RND transporter periplasmic adaptor subunit, partial [Brucella melitensis]|uniref:efflux RND transporter periplasmic adaptor subunit n=1 Tax=Brucella melitensis TaxID=29459 RepID=UPI003C6C9824
YAEFTLPDTDLARITAALKDGTLKTDVTVTSGEGKEVTESGRVDFIDNAVDPASGTVRLRATLDNRCGNFWPGQSLRISVELGKIDDLVLVPDVAVEPQENGSISYV